MSNMTEQRSSYDADTDSRINRRITIYSSPSPGLFGYIQILHLQLFKVQNTEDLE